MASDGHTGVDVLLNGTTQTTAQSLTNQVVSKVFALSTEMRTYFQAVAVTGDITVAAGISLKLQTSLDGTNWFTTAASVALAADTTAYKLDINATDDKADLPLGPLGRLVVTTGAGDTSVITSLMIGKVR